MPSRCVPALPRFVRASLTSRSNPSPLLPSGCMQTARTWRELAVNVVGSLLAAAYAFLLERTHAPEELHSSDTNISADSLLANLSTAQANMSESVLTGAVADAAQPMEANVSAAGLSAVEGVCKGGNAFWEDYLRDWYARRPTLQLLASATTFLFNAPSLASAYLPAKGRENLSWSSRSVTYSITDEPADRLDPQLPVIFSMSINSNVDTRDAFRPLGPDEHTCISCTTHSCAHAEAFLAGALPLRTMQRRSRMKMPSVSC